MKAQAKEIYIRQLRFNGNFPLVDSHELSFWRRIRIAFFILFGILDLKGTDIKLTNLWLTLEPEESRPC